jgi:hypothetical protein
MADEPIVFDTTPDQAFNLQKQRLNAGMLGAFFGTGPNLPLYIAAFTIILLFVGGMVVTVWETKMPAAEYWKFAASIISASIGFIFGRKG